MNLLKPIIHPLWQLLPHKFRRRLFDLISRSGISEVAPNRPEQLSQPITIAGYLTASTGLGQAARLAVLALEQQGYKVNTYDLTEALFHECEVEFKRPRMQKGAGTLLLYVNPPVSSLAMKTIGEGLLKDKHRMGCWIWELPQAPDEWKAHIPFFHEIASSSRFACDAIQAICPTPVRELLHPVAAEPLFTPKLRPEGDPFRVAAMMDIGSRTARKNPDACVEAFALAFGAQGLNCMDSVVLDLKLLRPGAEPLRYAALMRRIAELKLNVKMTINQSDRATIQNWLAGCDVLISLHTAEGFGLACAEAMLYGVPCVSTNWSATAEYIDASCGYPVDFTLVPAQDETGLYEFPDQNWAKADVHSAAEQLKQAYLNADDRRARGQAAQAKMQERFSSAAFCNRLNLTPHPTPCG